MTTRGERRERQQRPLAGARGHEAGDHRLAHESDRERDVEPRR